MNTHEKLLEARGEVSDEEVKSRQPIDHETHCGACKKFVEKSKWTPIGCSRLPVCSDCYTNPDHYSNLNPGTNLKGDSTMLNQGTILLVYMLLAATFLYIFLDDDDDQSN